MNEDSELLNRKICHILDQGANEIDASIAARLHQARRVALDRYFVTASNSRLATINGSAVRNLLHHARATLMIVALGLGALSAYYWNGFEQAQEHVEIDSELLADELPPSAYIDPGFQEWLDTTSHLSLPQN